MAVAEEVFAVKDLGSSSAEATMATTMIGRWQRRKGGCWDFQFGRPKTMGADRGRREEKAAATVKLNLAVVVRESAFYSASYIISVSIHQGFRFKVHQAPFITLCIVDRPYH